MQAKTIRDRQVSPVALAYSQPYCFQAGSNAREERTRRDYAAFHHALDRLQKDDPAAYGRICASARKHSELWNWYVNRGHQGDTVRQKIGADGHDLRRRRNGADYDDVPQLAPSRAAQGAVQRAKNVIGTIQALWRAHIARSGLRLIPTPLPTSAEVPQRLG